VSLIVFSVVGGPGFNKLRSVLMQIWSLYLFTLRVFWAVARSFGLLDFSASFDEHAKKVWKVMELMGALTLVQDTRIS
jgi:hypothetical protein